MRGALQKAGSSGAFCAVVVLGVEYFTDMLKQGYLVLIGFRSVFRAAFLRVCLGSGARELIR